MTHLFIPFDFICRVRWHFVVTKSQHSEASWYISVTINVDIHALVIADLTYRAVGRVCFVDALLFDAISMQ